MTFNVEKAKLVAIVGANGVGKSTLLRSIAGVQNTLGGEVKLNHKNLKNYNALELAAELSIVLTEQLPSINLMVSEVVALGRQPYTNWIGTLSPEDYQRVEDAMKRVHIFSLRNKKCYELSDGQLQKVMIARALAQETSLIILDEPTTHLDIYHKAYILKLLKNITRETGKTILFSTHEIELAIQLCDEMLVMSNDKISFGEPCELIQQGVFDSLFPKDLIWFEPETGTFRIKK
ncbi:ABC transporter ATP-binding protein [Ascidiimonas meishanensis]|uniref:ABC transporter ATP-binding protein n=1 Tax=Ascidiimonas meishanensis TaxID=3128903 RepID=UPI0039B77B32